MIQFSEMKGLTPPSTPAEAILSRRNPCYGFGVLADIRDKKELNALLASVRDSILPIINHPPRLNTKSPLYIKQKHFHAALFGMNPLLEQQDYYAISDEKEGLVTSALFKKISTTLKTHLDINNPYLEPMGFELMPKDGTILARFAYKTNNIDDATPLLSLASQIDPDNVFKRWDSKNPERLKTVTVALAVVNINEITPEDVKKIQSILADKTVELTKLGNVEIEKISLVEYNKRTLSKKHITAECKPIRKTRLEVLGTAPFNKLTDANKDLSNAWDQLTLILSRIKQKIAKEKNNFAKGEAYFNTTPEIHTAMTKLDNYFKRIVEEKPANTSIRWTPRGLVTFAASAWMRSKCSDPRATYDEDYCIERGITMDMARLTPEMIKYQKYVISDPALLNAYSQLCQEYEAFKAVQDVENAKRNDMFKGSTSRSLK